SRRRHTRSKRDWSSDVCSSDLDNIARMFKMAIAYGEKIGHKPQFLLEPKPKEPTKHQYDFDAATAMAFIQKYGLEGDFKLNLERSEERRVGKESRWRKARGQVR